MRRLQVHAYHLAPAGTGKAAGVRIDRERHGIDRDGRGLHRRLAGRPRRARARSGECWLVANAEAALEWPHRTTGSYGAGVAELIDRLLAADG